MLLLIFYIILYYIILDQFLTKKNYNYILYTSAQPPTPSATANNYLSVKYASSPPLCTFSGCGIICAAKLK